MIHHSKKMLFLLFGHLFVALGVLGIFLPVLPTTPFALLAAYCYSRGSKKLHDWLLSTKSLGPLIKDWERYGVVRPRAKVLATVMIVALFSYTLVFVPVAIWIKILLILIALGVLIFLWTRPSSPRGPHGP